MVEKVGPNIHPGNKPFRALILGERGISDLIAEQLKKSGIDSALHPLEFLLPSPYEGGAPANLRDLIEKFKSENEASASLLIHPGVSIWAERPELNTLSQQLGIPVISPNVRTLTLFSDKLNLVSQAEKLRVPTLMVGDEPIHSVREIEELLAESRQSFPFVLKAVRGGGSFRLLVIHSNEDLRTQLPLWLDQLRKNFGDVILFVERYLQSARHLVVPFVRLSDGRTRIFPIVDASLQSRHRKIVEFCPVESVDPPVLESIRKATAMLAESWSYRGVGVMEFLVEGTRYFFIDALPRLDTGFHLWEKVAGTQAVAWQLFAYGLIDQEPRVTPTETWSSGIALRVFAEDSMLQLPHPGRVEELSPEQNIRDDQAELIWVARRGEEVLHSSNGNLAYLWAGGKTRAAALSLIRKMESQMWIAGTLQSNERFLADLLEHPWVREGIFHAGFIDEDFVPAIHPGAEVLRTMASVVEIASQHEVQGSDTPSTRFRWAVADQWVKVDSTLIQWKEEPIFLKPPRSSLVHFGISGVLNNRMSEGSPFLRVLAVPIEENRWQVRLGNWFFHVRRVPILPHRVQGLKNTEKKIVQLHALTSGKVHSVLFRPGSTVSPHEPMVMLESLGMLIPHAVPTDVRIVKWKVSAEQIVHAGQELADLEL
ncbi:MAG: hypothetical protein AABZ55_15985 [Bdellovibrionota bacterium]